MMAVAVVVAAGQHTRWVWRQSLWHPFHVQTMPPPSGSRGCQTNGDNPGRDGSQHPDKSTCMRTCTPNADWAIALLLSVCAAVNNECLAHYLAKPLTLSQCDSLVRPWRRLIETIGLFMLTNQNYPLELDCNAAAGVQWMSACTRISVVCLLPSIPVLRHAVVWCVTAVMGITWPACLHFSDIANLWLFTVVACTTLCQPDSWTLFQWTCYAHHDAIR